MSGYEQWELLVFIVFAALAIFSAFLVYRESSKGAESLKDKIRKRTKSQMAGVI